MALEVSGAALEREPGIPLALAVRGAALADLGRGKEAKAACRAALRSTRQHHGSPEDIACDALGRVALAEGAEGAAAAWFERALAIDPRREGARRALEGIRSRVVAGPGS
ncbi:hypothetical protein L6R50_21975 [Myxococcota bacterium]|nr:hypothetical protein [Myxococcota bacterium]